MYDPDDAAFMKAVDDELARQATEEGYLVLVGPNRYAGVDIPQMMILTVYQTLIGDKYQDSFWYGGQNNGVMKLQYGNRIVFIDAPGDIKVYDLNEEHRSVIRGVQDLYESEIDLGDDLFREDPDTGESRWSWDNNNWFEMFPAMVGDENALDMNADVDYEYSTALSNAITAIQDDEWWSPMESFGDTRPAVGQGYSDPCLDDDIHFGTRSAGDY